MGGGNSWNRQGPPASFSSLMPVGLSCLCSRNILLHDRCMPPRCTREACSPTSTCHRSPFLIASLSPDISIREEKSRKLERQARDRVLFSRPTRNRYPFIQFKRRKNMSLLFPVSFKEGVENVLILVSRREERFLLRRV